MATKDISDIQIVMAYAEWQQDHDETAEKILMKQTQQPEKVCFRAMERAEKRGLIDCGVSLRTGWLTEKGKQLLKNEE